MINIMLNDILLFFLIGYKIGFNKSIILVKSLFLSRIYSSFDFINFYKISNKNLTKINIKNM